MKSSRLNTTAGTQLNQAPEADLGPMAFPLPYTIHLSQIVYSHPKTLSHISV